MKFKLFVEGYTGVLNINTFLGLFFTLFLFHEEEWWASVL